MFPSISHRIFFIALMLMGVVFGLQQTQQRSVAQVVDEEAEPMTAVMQAFIEKYQPPQNLNALAATPCEDGMAGIYPCENVDLLAFMPLGDMGGGSGNDIWGWTGCSGREFALMGRSSGTSFVEISDPENPVYLGNLPTHTINSLWRDIKTYADHAFVVSEASGHGMQIFDLTELCSVPSPPVTFSNTAHYNGFGNAHNVVINEDSGFAYSVGANCSGGLHMVDISTPTSPTFAGCFSSDGYTHDAQCVIYNGPDTEHVGSEVCFNYNEDTLTIVDVTDKNSPDQLSRTGYSGSAYSHQGWLTEDHEHVLLGDELDETGFGHNTRTRIWDVSDLDNPSLIGFHDAATAATDHNLYIKGDYTYQSNYRAGLRILNIEDIANGNLVEEAFFDTYPPDDNAGASSPGTWSNYPYFESGIVVVSQIEAGLFILQPTINFNLDATPNPLSVCAPNDAVFTVNVNSSASFIGIVNLSVAGQPTPPNSASFSVNGQSFPYSSILTMGTTGASDGSYDIDVIGSSATATHTKTVQLNVESTVPSNPSLASPLNEATDVTFTPDFEWTAVADATEYRLEVATDMAFTNIVYDATITPPTTTHTTSTPLSGETTYYWRVIANNICGDAPTPEVFVFTTLARSLICNGSTVEFEGGIPSDWVAINSGSVYWSTTNDLVACDNGGNRINGSGRAACADADQMNHPDPQAYDAELWTNAIDLSGFSNVMLEFEADYKDANSQNDGFEVAVSTNGGSSWDNHLSWAESHIIESVTIDLSDYADESDVMVRYRYYGSGWDWWVQIDEVALSCTNVDIMVSPSVLTSTQGMDTETMQMVTISNDGDGRLDWEAIESAVVTEGAGCDGTALDWVSVSSMNGSVDPASSQDVEVMFDSTGLFGGEYEGTLCIESNDLDTPQIEIPLTLTVVQTIFYTYIPIMSTDLE